MVTAFATILDLVFFAGGDASDKISTIAFVFFASGDASNSRSAFTGVGQPWTDFFIASNSAFLFFDTFIFKRGGNLMCKNSANLSNAMKNSSLIAAR